MNPTNTQQPTIGAALAALHADRDFFPTDRQRQLYETLLGAPRPAPETTQDADRLTLLGYGGAKDSPPPIFPLRGEMPQPALGSVPGTGGSLTPEPSRASQTGCYHGTR